MAKKEMKTLFVDMDGTLFRYKSLDVEDMRVPGYFRNLKPHTDLVQAVQYLVHLSHHVDNLKVFILSAYLEDTPSAKQEKRESLAEHMPFIDDDHILLVPSKISKAEFIGRPLTINDFLLDDYSKNLIGWEQSGGTGIKILTEINGKYGSWDGSAIQYDQPYNELLKKLTAIVVEGQTIKEKPYNIVDKESDMINKIIQIAQTYGYDPQARQAIEEMAELTQALNKEWRKRNFGGSHNDVEQARLDIVGELADVQIMIHQIVHFMSNEKELNDAIASKVERQFKRIADNK